MSEIVTQSLQKIAKGTGIVFIGSLAGLFLAFIGRLMIARYGTVSEYGVFSLALVILNICVVISTLGLQRGVTRSIAYAIGKNEYEKIQGFISASVWLSIAASLTLGLILFLTSGSIAISIFHEPALTAPLKIFSIAIPFFTLSSVLVSIFLGFGRVQAKVYFQDILRNVLFTILLLAVILLSLSFTSVFYAYTLSLAIPCLLLVIYTVKYLPSSIRYTAKPTNNANPIARELLFFSLPLLGVAMLQMMIAWTDTLMLGSFKSTAEVGLYNAAYPLANFISSPLSALLVIYMPITSGLYAQGLMPEMRRNFAILTKWLCSLSLPLFLILFLFPEAVLNFLFGANYIFAANALRILSIGYIINNFLGPNGSTLIAIGESKFMMWATAATAILNIGLNIALIPTLGIVGAAIASVVAITSINLIRCWKLYSLSKAQPLSKNLIKPTLASLVLIFLIYFILREFLTVTPWMLPLLFILYYALYSSAILFTKSFDLEDINLLLAIERKMGINFRRTKNLLRKFV
jgi:O-antigen/teichoic acid export membrane protein